MKIIYLYLLVGTLGLAACSLLTTTQSDSTPVEEVSLTVTTQPEPTVPPLTSPLPTPTQKVTNSTENSPLLTPTSENRVPTPVSPLTTPISSQTVPEESQKQDKSPDIPSDVVIVYQISGGFAGINEQWTIYLDGRIKANDGREGQVTPEDVEQLLVDSENLGFFDMDSQFLPLNTCCDRFTYGVTIRKGDRVNTVTTIDAAPNAPPELQKIIAEVSRLLADVKGN